MAETACEEITAEIPGANARVPASEYWDYQLTQNYIYPRASFGEEPWASKLQALPDELIPMFRREDIHVVVGGKSTSFAMTLHYGHEQGVDTVDIYFGV